MTLRSSDLQSDSDLDSIRNSCDVSFSFRDKAPDQEGNLNVRLKEETGRQKLPIFHNEWALDSGQGEQEDIYWAKMLKSAHQDDIYQ